MRILIFLLTISAQVLIAQTPTVSYRDQAIKVDGILDESVWEGLEVLTDFNNFYPINDGKAKLQTEVRVFHNGKNLNIAVIYHDTISEINISSLKRDNHGAGMHLSDNFGVVIDPYRNQNRGYFFGLNAGGTQVDGLISNYSDLNTSWNVVWQGKTSVDGTDKIYELSIPLSSINYNPSAPFWNFQFYLRDTKINLYSTWTKFPRGFVQFDTRHLGKVKMENLVKSKSSRLTIIPSITTSYSKNSFANSNKITIKPSIDAQYNITSGLRLNLTLNPDFSQIDVDRQVTNLTRFSINFPERRSFFLENSDLFSNLGTYTVDPFNSRSIGANGAIKFGIKLSGNILPKTRIGLLNVQSNKVDTFAQNYSVIVGQQQLSNQWTTTAFLINRQQTKKSKFADNYNRVMGLNLNYISKNKKWTGLANYAKGLTNEISNNNNFYNIEMNYNTRETSSRNSISKVDANYITELGFVPRLYNYDAELDKVIRAGYSYFYNDFKKTIYPHSKLIDSYRWLYGISEIYLDELGNFAEAKLTYKTVLFFKDLSLIYFNAFHDIIKLKYHFNPLRNDFTIQPGDYTSTAIRLGFESDYTKQFFFHANAQLGNFYGGSRQRFVVEGGYKLLPIAVFNVNYEFNHLAFNQNKKDFHLFGLVTEIFFSNKLNWTTYIQYNTQLDNINFNSRLQWEYRPLSYLYLVYTDNYNNNFKAKNKGLSLKLNFWLNL